jgi:signal transduction histidine kinase
MAPSQTSWLNTLVFIWMVVTVLALSIRETAAEERSGNAAAQPKTVLLLHSFGTDFPQGSAWTTEIQNELNRQSPWPLNIQQQYLLTTRDRDDAAETKLADYLKTLYAGRPPDLIVATNAPAARFVQQHRANLYPTTPMLLAAIEPRRIEPSMLTKQDAVVALRFDEISLVRNILRLLPKTKSISVILGNSPNERFWAAEAQRTLGPLLRANKVQMIFSNERSFEEILTQVANLPPYSAVLFLRLSVDGTGAVFGDKEPLKRISEVANAPVFSHDQVYFSGEIVGGPMFSAGEGALPIAAVATRMLRGEKAAGIEVPPVEFSPPKYDWRQLQRWHISEGRLPRGSEIYFRQASLWQRNSLQIGLVTAVAAQVVIILALLNANRRRQFAEVQSRQRLAELARVVRFSTAGELTASIAHEINQPLAAILTNAETADLILQSSKPDIAELKEIVRDIWRDDLRASEIIRRMNTLLKKTRFELKNLDLNDLVQDTIELLATVAKARNVPLVSVTKSDALPILGDHIQLQQVILSLVVNGIEAMRDTPIEKRIVTIRTSRLEKFTELSVSDRGSGIPEHKLKEVFEPFYTSRAGGMGMGLSIARTIVEAHDGMIWAQNRGHGGASFRIKLPLS